MGLISIFQDDHEYMPSFDKVRRCGPKVLPRHQNPSPITLTLTLALALTLTLDALILGGIY